MQELDQDLARSASPSSETTALCARASTARPLWRRAHVSVYLWKRSLDRLKLHHALNFWHSARTRWYPKQKSTRRPWPVAGHAASRPVPALRELIAADRLDSSIAANLNGDAFVSDPNTSLAATDRLLLLSADVGGYSPLLHFAIDPLPPGYHGCYLRIDLSRGRTDRCCAFENVLRQASVGRPRHAAAAR